MVLLLSLTACGQNKTPPQGEQSTGIFRAPDVLPTSAPSSFSSTVPAAAHQYQRPLTLAAHAVWGLNAPIATFGAQVQQESNWNENAQSTVGARGLAQFMPSTADWISATYPDELGPAQPYNAGWALRALVRYDYYLWDRITAATDCDRMAFTLTSYNGGLGWTYKDQERATTKGVDRTRYWGQVETINAGRSQANWEQSRNYSQRVIRVLQPRYLTWGIGVSCP